MRTIKILSKNSFIKSVLIVTGGTATAQLLNAMVSPIITRLYLPEEFGILSVYTAILGILSVIGTFKYELAIPISENDEDAMNVVALSVIVLFSFVGLVTIVLTCWGDSLLGLFSGSVIIGYKYLIPVGVLVIGLYSIFSQWALSKRNYTSLAKTKLSQSLTQNMFKISFGFLNIGPVGLIIGTVLGQSAGITTLAQQLIENDKNVLKRINITTICWCAKRYIKFPFYSASSQLLNTTGLQLPVIFLSSYYGNAISGYYGLATIIVNLPMDLIGRSVSDVFYGEAASLGRKDPDKLKELFNKLFIKLVLIGLVPLFILLIFAPFLFSLVFGVDWFEAGVYARIIAVLVYTRFIFTPISRVFSIFEKQREELFLDLFRMILVLLVLGITMSLTLNPYWAVGLYTLAMSIIYFSTFLLAKHIINVEVRLCKEKQLVSFQ